MGIRGARPSSPGYPPCSGVSAHTWWSCLGTSRTDRAGARLRSEPGPPTGNHTRSRARRPSASPVCVAPSDCPMGMVIACVRRVRMGSPASQRGSPAFRQVACRLRQLPPAFTFAPQRATGCRVGKPPPWPTPPPGTSPKIHPGLVGLPLARFTCLSRVDPHCAVGLAVPVPAGKPRDGAAGVGLLNSAAAPRSADPRAFGRWAR